MIPEYMKSDDAIKKAGNKALTIIQLILAHRESMRSQKAIVSEETYTKLCETFEKLDSSDSDYLYAFNKLQEHTSREEETLLRGDPDKYYQEENM